MRYVVLLKEIKMIEAKVCGYIVSCEGVEDFEFFIDKDDKELRDTSLITTRTGSNLKAKLYKVLPPFPKFFFWYYT
jgi:hypothetical protein